MNGSNREREYFAIVTLFVLNTYRQPTQKYPPHTWWHRTHCRWVGQTPGYLQDCNQIHGGLQEAAGQWDESSETNQLGAWTPDKKKDRVWCAGC